MKTEVTLDQAIGRTLQGIEASITCSQMVLVFTDGTFTTLGVDRGYNYGDGMLEGQELKLHHFGDKELIRLGVTTGEELNAIRNAREAAYRLQQEARDRAELVRLKRKFES